MDVYLLTNADSEQMSTKYTNVNLYVQKNKKVASITFCSFTMCASAVLAFFCGIETVMLYTCFFSDRVAHTQNKNFGTQECIKAVRLLRGTCHRYFIVASFSSL